MQAARRNRRRVLFVCMGNCVRSQMAEAIANYRGAGRFIAASAGACPAGYVHEGTLETLREIGIRPSGLRSKGWEEFGNQTFDAVITLCDQARVVLREQWPEPDPTARIRLPLRAHWPVADPTRLDLGTAEEYQQAFRETRDQIRDCVERLVLAPPEVVDEDAGLAELLTGIGQSLEQTGGEETPQ